MALTKISLRPGIYRNSTDYNNEGGYFACDKVRFRSGAPEKIGGWVRYMTASFVGTARMLYNWVTLDTTNIVAIGTNLKFYIESSGGLYDVTPIRSFASLGTDPIDTTEDSAVVIINHTAHGAINGDYVTLSGAASTGGIAAGVLNAEHLISYIDADSYSITVSTPATSSVSGGGAAVDADYQISATADVSIPGRGWNAGGWGRGTWDSPATTVTFSTLRLWSAEAFGEDLVFCTRNGQIYYWDYSDGLNHRATLLSAEPGAIEVPTVATKLLMSTQDRHLIAFGTNPIGSAAQDPLLIRWCDTENLTDWEPTVTNASGDLRVSSGNYIVTAVRLKQEILVFTDGSIFSLQFIGAPDIFGLQPTADNISIMSPNCVAVVGNAAFWMGNDKFYTYNGRVDTLLCTIDDYIFSDFNTTQSDQVHCGTNERFSEVWWFYCSASSDTIDRYVIYNYDEKTWVYGNMHRTVWMDSQLKNNPIAAANGTLYRHEDGVDDDRVTPIEAWIESSDFDIGDGEDFMFVSRILPDVSFVGSQSAAPQVTMTLTPRNSPGGAYKMGNSGTVARSMALPVERFTEMINLRLRGRQMKLRVESNTLGTHWQLGTPRIDMKVDGKK